MLSRIVLFLAQGRISPRRAAVMTFEGSLLVRCVTAMDRAPNFIFDLPRPKASSSEENDPASPAEYSSRPHTRTMLGVCDYGRMRTFLFVAVLCLCGCKGQPKETSVGYTAEQTQAIAALREAYAAFNRGDIDAAVKSLDEHIEWSEPAEFPGGGTYHGREGAKRYLAQSRAAWAEVVSEPEQFIVHGDQVVVFVHARVRAKGNNDWQDVKLADVYTFRDGKAIRMQAFADRQQALRSVGVEAPAG